jgi:NAD(P)-dependent dehydrogenase (short-subunit alcohol dehydrogenase family)
MSETILITGAGSGFGKGAAIGMARNGHNIIATCQVSPMSERCINETEAFAEAVVDIAESWGGVRKILRASEHNRNGRGNDRASSSNPTSSAARRPDWSLGECNPRHQRGT